MYYKTETLVSTSRNEYCLLYVGQSRRVGKIEVGVKTMHSGGVMFTPKSITCLPVDDIDGIRYEFNRLFEKATEQGFAPAWSRPAIAIDGRQLKLNFINHIN